MEESQVEKILRIIVCKELHNVLKNSSIWGYSGDLKTILEKFNVIIFLELEFLLCFNIHLISGGKT